MDLTFERLSTSVWAPPSIGALFAHRGLCGVSANGGLLRFHDAETGAIGQEYVDTTFAVDGLPADVFAFDWRARQFAVTTHVDDDGVITASPQAAVVVALDPFDMSITTWVPPHLFERALGTPLAHETLGPRMFDDWRLANSVGRLEPNECAGATVPGFYGGQMAVGNFTRDSLTVYLSFNSQLWAASRSQEIGDPAPILRIQP